MRAALLIPYHGGQFYQHLAAVNRLKALMGESLIQFSVYGCPYIDVARNLLVKFAQEERAKEIAAHHPDPIDRVLFIDHDIVFKEEDAVQLLRTLDMSAPVSGLHNVRIVAGVYSMKSPGSGKFIGAFHPKLREVFFFDNGGLYEANPKAGAGMGFCAIKLDVFDELAEKDPSMIEVSGVPVSGRETLIRPYFALEVCPEGYFGEDYSFCRRAHRIGITTWLDTRPRLWHLGSYPYVCEDAGAVVPQYQTLRITEPGIGGDPEPAVVQVVSLSEAQGQ